MSLFYFLHYKLTNGIIRKLFLIWYLVDTGKQEWKQRDHILQP